MAAAAEYNSTNRREAKRARFYLQTTNTEIAPREAKRVRFYIPFDQNGERFVLIVKR